MSRADPADAGFFRRAAGIFLASPSPGVRSFSPVSACFSAPCGSLPATGGCPAGAAAVGRLPFSSPNTTSPNLSSAWKSPTSGGDQAEALAALPSGASSRNMFNRQVSPSAGGIFTPGAPRPPTSDSGMAISATQPLS